MVVSAIQECSDWVSRFKKYVLAKRFRPRQDCREDRCSFHVLVVWLLACLFVRLSVCVFASVLICWFFVAHYPVLLCSVVRAFVSFLARSV